MSSSVIMVFLVVVICFIVLGAWFFNGSRFFASGSKEERLSAVKGYCYLTEGRPDAALEEFKRVTLKGSATPEAYITMSALYRLQGELDKAVHFSEEVLLGTDRQEDIIAAALRELARDYLIAGKSYNAHDCLQKLPKKLQNLPSVSLIQAEIAKEKGDFEAAARHYAKYEKQSGEKCDSVVIDMLIRAAQNAKDSTHKIKALRNIAKSYPKNWNARIILAEALFEEGKTEQGMAEVKAMAENDLIKTKADLRKLENIFYKYSTLDELFRIMSSRVAAESENPIPYLFISSYYGKKNDTVRAQEVLKAYLTQFPPKIIAAKAYARLANDAVLPRLAHFDNIYRCGVCKTEFGDFTAVCPKCGSVDSLDYE